MSSPVSFVPQAVCIVARSIALCIPHRLPQNSDPVTFTIESGNRIMDGTGSYGTVFPSSLLPYLMIPPPDFGPFYLDPVSGNLSFSTGMAPFSPIDYMSGPHSYELTIKMQDRSRLHLIPDTQIVFFTLRVDIIEVGCTSVYKGFLATSLFALAVSQVESPASFVCHLRHHRPFPFHRATKA